VTESIKIESEAPQPQKDAPVEQKTDITLPADETNTNIPAPLMAQPVLEYKKTVMDQILEKKKLLIIFGVVFVVIVMGALGWGVASKNSMPFFTAPTMTPTPTPTILPTQTPIPTIDVKLKRTDISVTVQNGTSTSGYAKEIGDLLEKKGYKNVGKTNADTDTYEKTILKIKEAKKNYLPLLFSDLKDKFNLTESTMLDASSSSDVILILGKT
jgi:hypothetical protein